MKVLTDTESLSAVAEAIRAKSGGDEPLVFPEGFVEAVEGIEGGNSYYDTFWDAFQQNCEKTDYAYAFAGSGWNDTTFKPKYNITEKTRAEGMFAYSEITDLKGILDELGITIDIGYSNNSCNFLAYSKITRCPTIDVRNSIYIDYICRGATELEEITILNLRKSYNLANNGFTGCAKLKTLIVTGTIGSLSLKDSPLLSNESVQSVIDALYDYTNETANTLSLHADVKATLTEEQLASITQKNWTVA